MDEMNKDVTTEDLGEIKKSNWKIKQGVIIVIVIAAAIAGFNIYHSVKVNSDIQAALSEAEQGTEQEGSANGREDEFVLTGVLSPIHSYNVNAKAAGQIVAVNIAKGDVVKNGEILVQQDATEVQLQAGQGSTTGELLQRLKVTYDLAEETYQKNKLLYEEGAISEMAMKQSQTQRDSAKLQYQGTANAVTEQTGKTTITSPGDGVVITLSVQVGDYASAGTAVASVVDISSLILKGNVQEYWLSSLKEGMKVDVAIASLGKAYPGEITFISPVSVASGQMFPIEITVSNPQGDIKGGMAASAQISQ